MAGRGRVPPGVPEAPRAGLAQMKEEPMKGRYIDDGHRLYAYADLLYVECPGCGERAVVVPRPGLPDLRYHSELLYRPRRLSCTGCGTTREWTAERRGNALVGVQLGGPGDPFFGLPLWLQTPCRGRVLWAYNERHLDTLEAYVAAGLRERAAWPTMSMLARLPAWIKAAGNRDDVLKAIKRLREQAGRHRHPMSRGSTARHQNNSYFRPPY
jgi:hypothetical protein